MLRQNRPDEPAGAWLAVSGVAYGQTMSGWFEQEQYAARDLWLVHRN